MSTQKEKRERRLLASTLGLTFCTFLPTYHSEPCGVLTAGTDRCVEHQSRVCSTKGCGQRATHGCNAFAGSFVCGSDLCDDCRHVSGASGTQHERFRPPPPKREATAADLGIGVPAPTTEDE